MTTFIFTPLSVFLLGALIFPSYVTDSDTSTDKKENENQTSTPRASDYVLLNQETRSLTSPSHASVDAVPGTSSSYRRQYGQPGPPLTRSDNEIQRILSEARNMAQKSKTGHGYRPNYPDEYYHQNQQNIFQPKRVYSERLHAERGPLHNNPSWMDFMLTNEAARQRPQYHPTSSEDHTTTSYNFPNSKPPTLENGEYDYSALGITKPETKPSGVAHGAADRFTTGTPKYIRILRTTPYRHSLFEDCDYLAYYCLKAYDTASVCAKSGHFIYHTFENYCVLDYINCIERYTVWTVRHMGECMEVKLLTEYKTLLLPSLETEYSYTTTTQKENEYQTSTLRVLDDVPIVQESLPPTTSQASVNTVTKNIEKTGQSYRRQYGQPGPHLTRSDREIQRLMNQYKNMVQRYRADKQGGYGPNNYSYRPNHQGNYHQNQQNLFHPNNSNSMPLRNDPGWKNFMVMKESGRQREFHRPTSAEELTAPTTKSFAFHQSKPPTLENGEYDYSALLITKPQGVPTKAVHGAADKFTTRVTRSRGRRRTTPEFVKFKENCDYIAYYCLKSYDTGKICARTLYMIRMTFENYCMVDYVNCMERYDLWQIAYMGECYRVELLSEYMHYPYLDDYFLDNYYIVEDM